MDVTPIVVLLSGLLFLMIIGIPLAFSLLLVSISVALAFTPISLWQLIQRFFAGMDSFILTAIPFFLLAGNLMNSGKITDKLINLATACVGRIRGGLAHINVLVSLFFGGVSGSAVADTSGIGTIFIPSMVKRGYDTSFTVVVTATSSVLSQIVPPSLIMIIYCATAGTSVQAMFVAGIVPGLLFAGIMMAISYYYAVRDNYPKEQTNGIKGFLKALKESALVLIMPIIIIGGVLTGVCTATESAVVAVVYSLIITLFIDKTLTVKQLVPIFIDTAKGTAASLFCIGAASVFGYLLAYFRTNALILSLMKSMNLTANTYILFLTVLFLILGCFMDATPAICIFVPIIIPTGIALGLHPVHLGMIVCLVLALGMVTPPYGLCLLLACKIAKIKPQLVFKDLGIMLLAILVVLCIIVYEPEIILFLPRLIVPKYL